MGRIYLRRQFVWLLLSAKCLCCMCGVHVAIGEPVGFADREQDLDRKVPAYRPGIRPWAVMYETRWRSNVTEEVLEQFVERLELNEDQQAIAEQLLADHRARFTELVQRGKGIEKDIHAKLAEAGRSSPERAALELEREKLLTPLADEQADLDQRILDEWATLIDPDDEMEEWRWRHFRWWFARSRWLSPATNFPDSEIDLLEVLREVEIEPDDSIDPSAFRDIMDSYARSIDDLIMRRLEVERGMARNYRRETEHRRRTDGERVWLGRASEDYYALLDRRREIRTETVRQLRDVHQTYRDLIVSLLPQAEHEAFARAYDHALIAQSWNAIDNPFQKHASVLFRQLKEHENLLDADQQEHVKVLEAEFEHKLRTAIRARIELINAAIERRLHRSPSGTGPADSYQKTHAAVNRLFEIEDQFAQLLWAMLTPEQRTHFEEPRPVRYRDLNTGELLPVGEKPGK